MRSFPARPNDVSKQSAIVLAMFCACCSAEPADVASRCRAPEGIDASPNSLVAVVELLESLPRPVTVECFVESLERPLNLIASESTFSAQPAAQGSPRIFGMYEGFIASWVPRGDGSHVLEFAEQRPDFRSVKAELHMPIEGAITYDDFAHVNKDPELGEGTICGGCHHLEEPVPDIGLGGTFYQSEALRVATAETVRVQTLRDLHDYCDPEFDPRRCDILAATFDHGEVVDSDFPRVLPTIYD